MPYGYYGYYGGDSRYILLLIASVIIALFAQIKVNSSYNKYSRIHNSASMSGAQTARRILDANGLSHVAIEQIGTRLGDHFDPRTNVLRLSPQVYSEASVASAAIAAHECGHAIQHADNYLPIRLRSMLVPIANLGSYASWILILLGIFFSAGGLVTIGIFVFCGFVAFQLVTLPVEFNASRRALVQLTDLGIANGEDAAGCKSVLSACALTYVAAALTAVVQLLRLLAIAGRRRR